MIPYLMQYRVDLSAVPNFLIAQVFTVQGANLPVVAVGRRTFISPANGMAGTKEAILTNGYLISKFSADANFKRTSKS